MGGRYEGCGEQDHAGGHALAAPAVPRVLPVRERLPLHPGRHAVRRHRLHRILMGTLGLRM